MFTTSSCYHQTVSSREFVALREDAEVTARHEAATFESLVCNLSSQRKFLEKLCQLEVGVIIGVLVLVTNERDDLFNREGHGASTHDRFDAPLHHF